MRTALRQRKSRESFAHTRLISVQLDSLLLTAACGQVRRDGVHEVRQRHGLQPHMTRTGEPGVEQALAAHKTVLGALHALNLQLHGAAESQNVTSVDNELLTWGKVILYERAIALYERNAVAGQALHDESLAAEEAAANLLVEVHG